MAGGYHLFSTGEVLTAANVDNYLMNQTVMVFASAAARATALSGVLAEGMCSYRTDAHVFEVYNGTAWVASETNLTTKGDLATFDTAPQRLAVGNNGERLVADSSSATGLRWQPSAPAGKNAIINGGFDIWQRGTSVAGTSNAYSADRWCNASANAWTTSRQATADTTNLPNIQYCARVQRNSGQTSTGAMYLATSLETINSIPFVGKSVVVSFYARAGANYSATSNALTMSIISGTGTDQNINVSYTGTVALSSPNYTLTTTWQKFTTTATVGTTATELALQFTYTPTGTAGANDYFEITGVQLELGSVATTFSRAGGSIGGELALCQRYYCTLGGGDFYGQYYNGSSQFVVSGRFPVTMRTTPTSTLPSGTTTNGVQQVGIGNYNASSLGYFAGAADGFSFTGTASGGTIYSPVAWLAATPRLLFSAEL